MSLPFTPKPGQILLFESLGLFRDPVGSFIISQEKDTRICHAAMMGNDGMIWTTGAQHGFWFGLAEAEKYLKKRKYHVAEWDLSISILQKILMLRASAKFKGQFYGFDKVARVIFLGNFPGEIRQLYKNQINPRDVKNPYCSQAVATVCRIAGIPVCTTYEDGSEWKTDTTAITPVNLYDWIGMKHSPIQFVYSN